MMTVWFFQWAINQWANIQGKIEGLKQPKTFIAVTELSKTCHSLLKLIKDGIQKKILWLLTDTKTESQSYFGIVKKLKI